MTCGSWKALVFDFDGTLAELNIDFDTMHSSLCTLMSAYHLPIGTLDPLPVLETVERAGMLLAQRDPVMSDAFLRDASQLIEGMEMDAACQGGLFTESRMLLTELQCRFIKTSIVTRNCRAAVRQVFPDIDLYCQAFIAREDTLHVKPHPDHLHAALRILAVSPSEAAMVGDHTIDIHSGRQGGLFTVGVLTGHTAREAFQIAKADLILSKASQILDYLPYPPQ